MPLKFLKEIITHVSSLAQYLVHYVQNKSGKELGLTAGIKQTELLRLEGDGVVTYAYE